MEAAWRAHVGKLTLAQMTSPEVVRAHLQSFQASVVGEGLAGTSIDGIADVQGVITSFLRESSTPSAEAFKALAVMEAEFARAQVVLELMAHMKKHLENNINTLAASHDTSA